MVENGQYADAAEIFERLADGALSRGVMQRAPHLFLQAGRARLHAGQVDRGISLIKRGLGLLADAGNWPLLYTAGTRSVWELTQMGQGEKARQIQDWLDEQLKDHPEAKTAAPPMAEKSPPRLPANCPNCGAAVRPNEVEWLDPATAECPYCGSVIQTGG
jgi:hypothetical protein